MCKRSPQVRQRWGCDVAAPIPFAYLTCERCLGYNPSCTLCKGDGKGRPHYDCPNRVLEPDTLLALSCQAMFESTGAMPVAGGIMDQSDAWLVAMRTIGSELGKHREAERQRWQEEAQRSRSS